MTRSLTVLVVTGIPILSSHSLLPVYCVCLALLFHARVCADVQYEFQYFVGRDGHRVAEVADMAESSNGSIWVATWGDGIHRINNTDYRNYTVADGLPTNWFRSIEIVGSDTIWANTRGFVPIINGRVGSTLLGEESNRLPDNDFRVVHSLNDRRVLAVTSEGQTLLFSAGNESVLPGEWSVIATRDTFQNSAPIGFAELGTGEILASVRDRGIYRLVGNEWQPIWGQGKSWLLRTTHDGPVSTVWAARIAGRDIFRLQKGIWKQVGSAPEEITCFHPLPDNRILVGSYSGVFRFSDGRWGALKMPTEIGALHIKSMLLSANGILWLGANEGLVRGTPQTWQGSFSTDDNVELVSLVQNRDDAAPLWFVDAKNRLIRSEDVGLRAFLQLEAADGYDVGLFTFPGEDSIWALTHRSVQKYSLDDGVLQRVWSLNEGINRLCRTQVAGHVLLTGRGAFSLRNDEWVEFPSVDGHQRKGVFDLVELEGGIILAGVEHGAELWHEGSVTHLRNAIHDVHSIHVKTNGRIWLGGLGQGVMKLEGDAVIQPENPALLNSSLVTNVYEARDGTLWATLRRGGVAALQDGRWINYGYEHGLPNADLDYIREDHDGIIWVSQRGGGVYAFQPDQTPPDTRFSEALDTYASHGVASFAFSAWDAWGRTPRESLVYSWRVLTEPGGEVVLPWSRQSLATTAVTPSLDPGDYRLEVRAADQGRNVDPTPATSAFHVQFPVWRQPAYMAPLAVVSLSAMLACFLWCASRIRRRRAEFERSHFERYAEDLEIAVAERTAESIENERQLRLIFENSPVGLWHLDFSRVMQRIGRLRQEGVDEFREYFEANTDDVAECARMFTILNVNSAASELHSAGCKHGPVDSILHAVNECSSSVFREQLIAWANGEMSFESDAEVRTLNGEKKSVLLKTFVNPNSPAWSSVFVALTDITERKRAENEAQEHRDELAHVARISSVGEMATGIAHELNQPLTAAASYSFAAKTIVNGDDTGSQQLREIFEKLENQVIRAGSIVRRWRNYLKKTESSRLPIGLTMLIRDVATFMELDIRQAETTLTVNCVEPSPNVLIDEIQIQQVLVNLIRNAIDAMKETAVGRREVTVSTRILHAGDAEVTVSDVGAGLTEFGVDQIFDAFSSTKQDGMGLGLAISRSIVEAHGGKLWCKSNNGPGVTFGFTIPREDAHEE